MYKKRVLKNGLKVITSRMPHMESVAIGLWIGVGGRYESKSLCGMSHLIEHMLFKGTLSRSASDLKEAIEGIGGSFNGFTSEELTCYLVKLPSKYASLGIDILSDMVLNPKFDPAELEKEKFVVCEEIKMYMDQPAQYVLEILAEVMWPGNALGRPIAGYIDSVKKFTRKDLTGFKERYYEPANMALAACGKIDPEGVLRLAKDKLSARSSRKRFPFERLKFSKKPRMEALFKDTKQTHIAIGFHALRRDHRMRYAQQLLNVILGGNMSSRLFERLRERNPLCYDISTSVRKYKETGAFVIHAGVDNKKLMKAAEEITKELKDIRGNLANPEELHRAKEYLKGQTLLALEGTGSRMLWLGDRIMTEGRALPVAKILKNIDRVSLEDIRRVAGAVFRKENLNFATIGPAGSAIEKKLERALIL